MPRPRRGAEPMDLAHFRIDGPDWTEFQAATGGEHAENLRQYVAWYLRRRGTRMPKRPPVPPRRDL